ncbi:MAG: FRG domain-containing protein, partial [Anaerolineales bacterium]
LCIVKVLECLSWASRHKLLGETSTLSEKPYFVSSFLAKVLIDDLYKHLLSYESHWIFRGHASETWILESTLERALKPIGWLPEMAKVCEEVALFKFQSKAHLYLSQEMLPKSTLGWLAMMQHHGIPTRLLDFTESPFIALFFAFDDAKPTQSDNCAIWALDYRSLMKSALDYIKGKGETLTLSYEDVQKQQDKYFEVVIDKHSYDVLWTTEPGMLNLRLERQLGSFLVCGNIGKQIAELIPEFLTRKSLKKIVIPIRLFGEIHNMLIRMGINHSKLFPDIDGLGKDIKEEILFRTYQVLSGKTSSQAPES